MALKAKVIAVSAAVLVVGTVGTIIGISVAKEDEYRVVKVFEMTGEAVVQREGTGELSAYVGMNLENGDILTVFYAREFAGGSSVIKQVVWNFEKE
jgi:hypothetical protein